MFTKYLIDMTKPEDAVVWRNSETIPPTGAQSKFTPAFGPHQKDEVGEIVYMKSGKGIPYHEHLDGCETFFFTEGEWEGFAMGKRFPIHPGEILHIQPFQGHGFRTVSESCRLIVMFQGKDMKDVREQHVYYKERYPEKFGTDEAERLFTRSEHDIIRKMPFDSFEEGDSCCHRKLGEGIRTHHFPGITLHLTVARYETHNIKEIWELELKKGFSVEFTEPSIEQRLFWVQKGHLEFTVDDEHFVAGPDMLVYVPPLHLCSFVATEDATMMDLDCTCQLQDYIEEMTLLQKTAPEQQQNEDVILELMDRFYVDRYVSQYTEDSEGKK